MEAAPTLAPAHPRKTEKQKKQKEVSIAIKGMLRSKKGTKKGVYIRVIINKQQEYFPTTYYVEPKFFDPVTGYVKGKHPDKEQLIVLSGSFKRNWMILFIT